ncbi:Protein CBR-SMP-2 [Caenorhabditis briggsae]|uniref:Protein CBR-SMP-2 n=1 Tax=Caenorhabditis briggsae TaxID=6238 RepID=A8XED9_CAEBR|nr:Protein CBR-SMP-2 [Caenorhabditis briggsae]CAP31074.2 Protein CBR-SMP-2 [Caenorhabditis briggsae]
MLYRIFNLLILSQFGSSSFFSADTNVSRVDVSHLTRILSFPKSQKLVVLHKVPNEFFILGGQNRVYNVSISSMTEISRYEWSSSEEARKNCAAISQNPASCENYIRTYFELTSDTFILCGTHALQPTCAEFKRENTKPLRLISAVGMSPIDADSTSPFIRSNENIITVNVAELSSSEPLLIRRNVVKMWKGIENDVILRTPRGLSSFEQANFLSMHKVKKEVLFFFSESPMETEGCGLHKVARVGRVCEDDPGGRLSYNKEWSSYEKARIECSIEENDTDTFYFNQFAGVAESPNSFYGAFRSQLAGIGASAICKYSKKSISKSFASGFRDSDSPDSCAKANELEELSRLRLKPLIKHKISANPIYIFHGKDRFVHVLAQEDSRDLSNRSFDILYVGTNLGNILKIVISNSEPGSNVTGRHAVTLKVLPSNSKITDMSLYTKNGVEELIVVTEQSVSHTKTLTAYYLNIQVIKVPSATCHLATNCAECLSHGDPHCAWADGAECIDIRTDRRKSASQDSGTCDVVSFDNHKPVLIPPLKNSELLVFEQITIKLIQKILLKFRYAYAKRKRLRNHVPLKLFKRKLFYLEVPVNQFNQPWKYITVFAVGVLTGSIFNYCYFYFSRNLGGKTAPSSRSSSSMTRPITTTSSTRVPIDAFTTSSIADEMFSSTLSSANRFNTVSMHSSIRTYC